METENVALQIHRKKGRGKRDTGWVVAKQSTFGVKVPVVQSGQKTRRVVFRGLSLFS